MHALPLNESGKVQSGQVLVGPKPRRLLAAQRACSRVYRVKWGFKESDWIRKLHIPNAMSVIHEVQSLRVPMSATLGKFSNAAIIAGVRPFSIILTGSRVRVI
jgi:hypothetical protein